MPDWVAEHKGSIQFVLWMFFGAAFLIVGTVGSDPAMIALGAGSLGLPGFSALAQDGKNA